MPARACSLSVLHVHCLGCAQIAECCHVIGLTSDGWHQDLHKVQVVYHRRCAKLATHADQLFLQSGDTHYIDGAGHWMFIKTHL